MTMQKPLDLTPYLLENGNVQSHEWPGGYPLYYLMQDCETMCPACVNANRESIDKAYADEDGQWNVIGVDANWEDENMYCCHCNKKIESAYGEDDKSCYEVIVGNIGTVYSGDSQTEADEVYMTYVGNSQHGSGRCAGEDVTMLRNGDIIREYIGSPFVTELS